MRVLILFVIALAAGFAIDAPVAAAVHDAPDWIRTAATPVTWLGDTGWQAIVLLALMIFFAISRPDPQSVARAHRLLQIATACFLLILLTGIAVQVLKHSFGRPRPEVLGNLSTFTMAPFGFQSGWNSFPSGHATTAGALAVLMARLWPRARLLALALAVLVAISRVILSRHYPSDVIAGLTLGAVLASWMLTRWQETGDLPRFDRPLRFPTAGFGPLSGLTDIPRSFARKLVALWRR